MYQKQFSSEKIQIHKRKRPNSNLVFFSEIKKKNLEIWFFFQKKKSKGPVQKMAGKVIWANNLIGWHNPHMNGGLETTLASSTRIRSQILNISILHSDSDIKPGS